MSIPTLQGLQTALSGLLAEQQALDVTGHNIANANTEGYSRQRAVFETNQADRDPGPVGDHGPGRPARHGRDGRDLHARAQQLPGRPVPQPEQRAERGLGDRPKSSNRRRRRSTSPRASGIASQLSEFWSSWNSLADSPNSEAAKQGVVAAGQRLASTLNALSRQLSTISGQAEAAVHHR
jgi:flagellar hook-associated protein 1 FlgK